MSSPSNPLQSTSSMTLPPPDSPNNSLRQPLVSPENTPPRYDLSSTPSKAGNTPADLRRRYKYLLGITQDTGLFADDSDGSDDDGEASASTLNHQQFLYPEEEKDYSALVKIIGTIFLGLNLSDYAFGVFNITIITAATQMLLGIKGGDAEVGVLLQNLPRAIYYCLIIPVGIASMTDSTASVVSTLHTKQAIADFFEAIGVLLPVMLKALTNKRSNELKDISELKSDTKKEQLNKLKRLYTKQLTLYRKESDKAEQAHLLDAMQDTLQAMTAYSNSDLDLQQAITAAQAALAQLAAPTRMSRSPSRSHRVGGAAGANLEALNSVEFKADNHSALAQYYNFKGRYYARADLTKAGTRVVEINGELFSISYATLRAIIEQENTLYARNEGTTKQQRINAGKKLQKLQSSAFSYIAPSFYDHWSPEEKAKMTGINKFFLEAGFWIFNVAVPYSLYALTFSIGAMAAGSGLAQIHCSPSLKKEALEGCLDRIDPGYWFAVWLCTFGQISLYVTRNLQHAAPLGHYFMRPIIGLTRAFIQANMAASKQEDCLLATRDYLMAFARSLFCDSIGDSLSDAYKTYANWEMMIVVGKALLNAVDRGITFSSLLLIAAINLFKDSTPSKAIGDFGLAIAIFAAVFDFSTKGKNWIHKAKKARKDRTINAINDKDERMPSQIVADRMDIKNIHNSTEDNIAPHELAKTVEERSHAIGVALVKTSSATRAAQRPLLYVIFLLAQLKGVRENLSYDIWKEHAAFCWVSFGIGCVAGRAVYEVYAGYISDDAGKNLGIAYEAWSGFFRKAAQKIQSAASPCCVKTPNAFPEKEIPALESKKHTITIRAATAA